MLMFRDVFISLWHSALCSAGRYIHLAEDPVGRYRIGLHMPDLRALLPCGHDPRKCNRSLTLIMGQFDLGVTGETITFDLDVGLNRCWVGIIHTVCGIIR